MTKHVVIVVGSGHNGITAAVYLAKAGLDELLEAPEDIAQKVAWVREAAGEDFERLELGYTVYHLLPTNGKTDAAFPQSLHVLTGSVDHIVEVLLAQRELYGFSYFQVMEQQKETFAPVVARLAGK